MGQYVNPGNDSFASAVLYSEIYVDKTGMLEYLNQVIHSEQRYVCVSRPRRFGKSITARMIAAYYSKGCNSARLFADCKIAGEKNFRQHLNQYNVIQLDIAELKVTMPKKEDFVSYIQKCVVRELRDTYPEMVEEGVSSLSLTLADINEKTGERFMDLAYLTGILPIKRYNSESALNNFREYTMTSPKRLAEYVGFTQEEVKDLCERYHMDFYGARQWYDGYGFKSLTHIYCPNSVINAMLDGEYNNYWTGTVAYESLKYYITLDRDGLKDAIVRLLSGEHVRVNVETFENDMTKIHSRDDVLTILIHLGYLGYDAENEEAYIPNEEVHKAFNGAVRGTDWSPVIEAIKASDSDKSHTCIIEEYEYCQ